MKIREIFCENPRIIFILFYDVHKENMFRTNLEDGREAPSTASNIKMPIISEHSLCPEIKVAARTNNTKSIGSAITHDITEIALPPLFTRQAV